MEYYLKTRFDRLGFDKVYWIVVKVAVGLLLLMSLATVLQWQAVASANYKLIHNFQYVH